MPPLLFSTVEWARKGVASNSTPIVRALVLRWPSKWASSSSAPNLTIDPYDSERRWTIFKGGVFE